MTKTKEVILTGEQAMDMYERAWGQLDDEDQLGLLAEMLDEEGQKEADDEVQNFRPRNTGGLTVTLILAEGDEEEDEEEEGE